MTCFEVLYYDCVTTHVRYLGDRYFLKGFIRRGNLGQTVQCCPLRCLVAVRHRRCFITSSTETRCLLIMRPVSPHLSTPTLQSLSHSAARFITCCGEKGCLRSKYSVYQRIVKMFRCITMRTLKMLHGWSQESGAYTN